MRVIFSKCGEGRGEVLEQIIHCLYKGYLFASVLQCDTIIIQNTKMKT